MNVLCIITIYNEIDFLPYKINWAVKNGFDIYVIDNYSTDGSFEWLRSHNIDCHQIDTNGSFDLRILHPEVIKTTDKLKPDWVVRNDADMFVFADKPISHLCMDAEEQDKNIIVFPMIDICRIGEAKLFENYWYRHARDSIGFIYKWSPGITYTADVVNVPNRNEMKVPGIIMNYGRTKSKEERKELLRRRQKAWKNGLNHTSGRHYLREKKKNWKWTKDELNDIRKSQYWKYLKDYE